MLEDLPVTLLTVKGNTEDHILGYEVGADAYLPKPFDPEELLSIVNDLTGGVKGNLSLSGDQFTYEGLKQQLAEIKSLMQDFSHAEKAVSPEVTEEGASLNSLSSLRGGPLEMKGNITQIVGNSTTDSLPPQSKTPLHQSSSVSLLTPGKFIPVFYVIFPCFMCKTQTYRTWYHNRGDNNHSVCRPGHDKQRYCVKNEMQCQ
jgi:CheY-like chemotaxis protein